MFGLFRKKEKLAFSCKDLVWISGNEKFAYLLSCVQQGSEKVIVVSYFPDDLDLFAKRLDDLAVEYARGGCGPGVGLFTMEEIRNDRLLLSSGDFQKIYFLEHYPLPTLEDRYLKDLSDRGYKGEVVFLLALEDPDMQKAGGERIIQLMKSLGMKEGESLDHPLITKAGRRFREKTEKKVIAERRCSSAAEWYRINLSDKTVL